MQTQTAIKVAIACDEGDSGPQVSKVFARCSQFALYDMDLDRIEYLDNPFRMVRDHAGEEAVRFLAEKGVKRIIGYEFGYRARKITEQQLIQLIVLGREHMLVNDVIHMIRETNRNA